MHRSAHHCQKLVTRMTTLLIVALLWTGLFEVHPTHAQEPAPFSSFSTAEPPAGPASRAAPADRTGYLHVHVLDTSTQTPISGQLVSLFDQNNVLYAQTTTTCSDYVEFPNLPAGAYRVSLGTQRDWVTVRREHTPGQGRRTTSEWVRIQPGTRTGVYIYQTPNLRNASLRVAAYNIRSRRGETPRQPLMGVLITVHNSAGQLVAQGTTGCGGFVDFTHLSPGPHRVAVASEIAAAQMFPPSGERRVILQAGIWIKTWFFAVPPVGPTSAPIP